MKYVIEFDLPDNDTVLNNIKTAWVGWNVWGFSGIAHAKPKHTERKKGKWIPMVVSSGRDSWQCSVCGRRARGKIENLPYCHCGAKMEEGEQDAV